MTALILYDSFALARKANLLLDRAVNTASRCLDWKVLAWRTDLLRWKPLSDAALHEAAEAHLIICAWSDNRPFHHWTERWLAQWVAGQSATDAAIGILGESDVIEAAAAIEMARFAEKHGITLIAGRKMALPVTPDSRNHDRRLEALACQPNCIQAALNPLGLVQAWLPR